MQSVINIHIIVHMVFIFCLQVHTEGLAQRKCNIHRREQKFSKFDLNAHQFDFLISTDYQHSIYICYIYAFYKIGLQLIHAIILNIYYGLIYI